jgi:hypothetical protein
MYRAYLFYNCTNQKMRNIKYRHAIKRTKRTKPHYLEQVSYFITCPVLALSKHLIGISGTFHFSSSLPVSSSNLQYTVSTASFTTITKQEQNIYNIAGTVTNANAYVCIPKSVYYIAHGSIRNFTKLYNIKHQMQTISS